MSKPSPSNAENVGQTMPGYLVRAHAEILSGITSFSDDGSEDLAHARWMDEVKDENGNVSRPYQFNVRSIIEDTILNNPYEHAAALDPKETNDNIESELAKFESVVASEYTKEKASIDEFYTDPTVPTGTSSSFNSADVLNDNIVIENPITINPITPDTISSAGVTLAAGQIDVLELDVAPVADTALSVTTPTVTSPGAISLTNPSYSDIDDVSIVGSITATASSGAASTVDVIAKETLDFSFDPNTAYEGTLDTSEFEAATEPEFLRSRSQFESAMYEVNAIQTSAYIIGLALRDIERSKQIALAAKTQMIERGNGVLQYKIAAATEDSRLKQLYMQLKSESAKLTAQLSTSVSQSYAELQTRVSEFNKQYEMTVSQLNAQFSLDIKKINKQLSIDLAQMNANRDLEIAKIYAQLTQDKNLTQAQIELEVSKMHALYDSDLVKLNSAADLEMKRLANQLVLEKAKVNAQLNTEANQALAQIKAQMDIANQQSVNATQVAIYDTNFRTLLENQSTLTKVNALEASVYSAQMQNAAAKMQTAAQFRLAFIQAKSNTMQAQIEAAKIAYVSKREQMQQDLEYDTGHVTWELEALKERASIIGAINGAPMATKKPSQLASAISSAISTGANVGMSLGMATGNPLIGLAGAGLGAAAGWLGSVFA